MARVSWREIKERFSHIDARFVACDIGFPDNDGFFTVEMYPWWEHPLYIAARDEGKSWGFSDKSRNGYAKVTVYPKHVSKARLSRQEDVIDWGFTQHHPILWQYEEHGSITCNSSMTLEQWLEISAEVEGMLTGYNRYSDVASYALHQVRDWGHTESFSLGSFPFTLFGHVCQTLDVHGVRYLASSPPEDKSMPVLFLIDDDDYIIADDFEIDSPDFVHKPEWFKPI